MSLQNRTRKQRKAISEEIFDQIVRLRETRSKADLMTIIGIGKSALDKLIQRLDLLEENETPIYTNFYKTAGPKLKDKTNR